MIVYILRAFVLGLLVNLGDSYEVKSNRESGYGRYDVMLILKNTSQKGIIFKFKKTNRSQQESLSEAVDAALKQIEDKNYALEYYFTLQTSLFKLYLPPYPFTINCLTN